MRKITLNNTSKKDFHQFMLGGITPRPIALVSTISEKGVPNLAPYSYFNAVSSIPPILMVSIGRKPDGNKKDTLINIENNGQFVVNMVNHPMIRQMALTSVQLPMDEDEFMLAGFETLESTEIKPYRVKNAPIQFECKVNRIIEMGSQQNPCNLVFGDVQCIHIDEKIIGENNRIDPVRLEIVGRLGRSYYTKTDVETIETVVVPQGKIPIGFQALPKSIQNSEVLSTNDIAQLAAMHELPREMEKANAVAAFIKNYPDIEPSTFHQKIKALIHTGETELALKLALAMG